MSLILGILAQSGGAAGAAGTFESIATVNVGSGSSANVEFTSISSSYKHLQIRSITRTDRGTYSSDRFNINFNSDTGSNYSYHTFDAQGSGSGGTGYGASETFIDISMATGSAATGSIFTGTVIDILDYANTSKYKSVRGTSGYDNNSGSANLQGYVSFSSGNWMNTNAITSIKLTPRYGTNFVQYSQFALYGIKDS
jgi:hypothetical protein